MDQVNEWKARAEMVWRQRDAADRQAARAETKLAEVEALCTTPVDGEQRSHVPVREVLAVLHPAAVGDDR